MRHARNKFRYLIPPNKLRGITLSLAEVFHRSRRVRGTETNQCRARPPGNYSGWKINSLSPRCRPLHGRDGTTGAGAGAGELIGGNLHESTYYTFESHGGMITREIISRASNLPSASLLCSLSPPPPPPAGGSFVEGFAVNRTAKEWFSSLYRLQWDYLSRFSFRADVPFNSAKGHGQADGRRVAIEIRRA